MNTYPNQIIWVSKPQWDSEGNCYCWLGYNMPYTEENQEPLKIPLGDDEIGSNGLPVPDAQPPSNQQPHQVPRGNAGDPYSVDLQPRTDYEVSTQFSPVSNYYTHVSEGRNPDLGLANSMPRASSQIPSELGDFTRSDSYPVPYASTSGAVYPQGTTSPSQAPAQLVDQSGYSGLIEDGSMPMTSNKGKGVALPHSREEPKQHRRSSHTDSRSSHGRSSHAKSSSRHHDDKHQWDKSQTASRGYDQTNTGHGIHSAELSMQGPYYTMSPQSAVQDTPRVSSNMNTVPQLSTVAEIGPSQALSGFDASNSMAGFGGRPSESSTSRGHPDNSTSIAPNNLAGISVDGSRGKRVQNTLGHREADMLDRNFRVYPSWCFKPGQIIKVAWPEPQGQHSKMPRGPHGSKLSVGGVLRVSVKDHLKKIHTGFRRFIIIKNYEGHCTCVPIYSYGNQGCTKDGAKPKHHGIIYEEGKSPRLVPKEPELGFNPICARTTHGDPLTQTSRVNYSKIVTVEHNIVVMFLAEVVERDWDIAKAAVKSFF